MNKEKVLELLSELSFKNFKFNWTSVYKLSLEEVNFVLGILSRAIVMEKVLTEKFGIEEANKLIDKELENFEVLDVRGN
jgi:hypothetical protein